MHQTFYIDVDEEISSVIDRLNKSMSVENYFVVPKRALFLQSIVNLKILKREADKLLKKVIIVTQDEMVESMAERCGIKTRHSIDGLNSLQQNYIPEEESGSDDEEEFVQQTNFGSEKKMRLNSLGSGEFYMSDNELSDVPHPRHAQKTPLHHATRNQVKINTRPKKIVLTEKPKTLSGQTKVVNGINAKQKIQLDPHKAETLERLFSKEKAQHEIEKHQVKNINSGKVKKVFTFFLLLCTSVLMGVGAYLYIPSAKVLIKTDIAKKKIDTEIIATNEADVKDKTVPLKIIEKEQEFSFNYEVTGSSEVAGKKARGKVTIYNEYSSEDQTLIATTRLEAENGKIFRLVKNVIVPGTKIVDGQTKPGVIQAEVVADKAGDDYNVEAGKFKIPGFAGGPKYEKFYAVSDNAMTGGAGDGQSASGAGVVTQTDLDGAKQKAELAFKEKIIQSIKSEVLENEVLLDQAYKIEIVKSAASSKVGSTVESLEWKISGTAKALIFNEKDVTEVIEDLNKGNSSKVKNEISKIDYGTAEADFDKPSLKLRVYAEISSKPMLEIEKIKKEILGKNDNQLAEILRKYPDIKNANIEFSPSFVTRIPAYESRVTLEVLNEAN